MSTKRKMSEEGEDREGRCTYYNAKKTRYCRQVLSPRLPEPFASEKDFQAIYCGNHGSMYSELLKDRKRQKTIHDDSTKGKRIPCPIDPSHMIYESNVKSHVLKCPKAKIANEERQRTYYQHDINTGGCGIDQFQPLKKTGIIEPQEFALRILNAYKNTFMKTLDKVKVDVSSMTEEEMYQAIPMQNHFPSEETLGLESIITKHRIKIGGKKHLEQIGSIVGHARNNNLLEGANTVLEMGAGRATTGFVVSGVCAAKKEMKVKLVLVERGGSRAKADTALRRIKDESEEVKANADETSVKEYLNAEDVDVHRIKCDLAHVNLPRALEEADGEVGEQSLICQEVNRKKEKRDILVIAKHLCGAGTDLALKSIYPIRHRVNGYILATCCHGVCNWNDYVGRDFLAKVMCTAEESSSFGEEEFNLMKRWACATVIGVGREGLANGSDNASTEQETDNEHTNNADDGQEEMSVWRVLSTMGIKCGHRGLGRACQRLIDYGRCEYMRNELFTSANVKLCHYVDSSVTPQNALLFGQANI